jgi:hypothetical protein
MGKSGPVWGAGLLKCYTSVKLSPRYTRLTSGSLPSSAGVPARKMRPSWMMYARSVTVVPARQVHQHPMPLAFRR